MIIYNCRTQKLPTSKDFIYNESNQYKMLRYNKDLLSECHSLEKQQRLTEDVYYTYNTLVEFNNTFDRDVSHAFELLNEYVMTHEEIKTSKDRKCQIYYEKMSYWNNSYNSNQLDENIKRIIMEIKQIMKYLCKIELIKESSCNLKSNYY